MTVAINARIRCNVVKGEQIKLHRVTFGSAGRAGAWQSEQINVEQLHTRDPEAVNGSISISPRFEDDILGISP